MPAINLYFRYLRPPPPRGTYVAPIEYRAPKTVIDARQLIIVLGERLANGELPIEAHDALVGGLRAYLGDKAVEQQKTLERLAESLRFNET